MMDFLLHPYKILPNTIFIAVKDIQLSLKRVAKSFLMCIPDFDTNFLFLFVTLIPTNHKQKKDETKYKL